ncbi:uncharacterized protein LOC131221755 [Magnolia sinica]|uniref:uncharacterized protein LOC131221755 n=1 Tax=Magnolia sinica TaxID=86752 RepID=UPI00265AFFD6|nr:uncharacterized protein LOC131221755 [Magnolia sinica]
MAARWINPIRPSAIILTAVLLSIWTVRSVSREIRPSDHGLPFQKPPSKTSPAMAAFFKGTPSSSSQVALPEARNSSDPYWGRGNLEHGKREGGGHVRGVLLVASLTCGAVGFTLMLAAAFVYLFQVRKSK